MFLNLPFYLEPIIYFCIVYGFLGLIIKRISRGPSRAYDNVNLEGKVVIITGSSAGVGKLAAKQIAKHGASIIFACRNKEKTLNVIKEIQEQTGNKALFFIPIELSDYQSVYKFSEEFHKSFDRIDILINNAGVANMQRSFNKEGHELTFATNHLGHFLLTDLLMDLLIKTEKSRIINVSSAAYKMVRSTPNYEAILKGEDTVLNQLYGTSKFANIVYTFDLQDRFDRKNVQCKAVSLHPGVVRSEIWSKSITKWYLTVIVTLGLLIMWPITLNEEEGAWTTNYTALMPWEELTPAGFYSQNSLKRLSRLVRDPEQRKILWDFSEQKFGIKTNI